MTQKTPWTASLRTKFAGAILALLVIFAVQLAVSLYSASSFLAEVHSMSFVAKGRTAFPMLVEAQRLPQVEDADRARRVAELRRLMAETEARLQALRSGDRVLGISPEEDERLLSNLAERDRLWRERIRPSLQALLDAQPGAAPAAASTAALEESLRRFAVLVDEAVELREEQAVATMQRLKVSQWAVAVLLLAILLAVFWMLNRVVTRTRSLASVAESIRDGDLSLSAPASDPDEIGSLGRAFNDMTGNLRDRIEAESKGREKLEEALAAIVETANRLSSSAAEILAGTSQQAAGMREQASAVAETVTTVDEVLQTAEQSAERANAVLEASQRAAEVSSAGREGVEQTLALMTQLQERSVSTAEGILRLAEHGQEIGEIIAAVTDIADQTNLLAVNASIEASRAGESGKGFTVVASEIKELASQSKRSTAQVRQILGEIQKSTNSAVLATEESTRAVERALHAVTESGETITKLEETIDGSSRAAAQIAASAAQQATGMGQIQQAMNHINQASTQNLSATRQTEQAAQDLNELGRRLRDLLGQHG